MGILLFLVFGLVIGLLARAIVPGTQKMGMGMTALLGIAGSLVGGFLASVVNHSRVEDFNTAGAIGSIIGAILVLVMVGSMSGRRALS
jgi:uncharacterized membrane protein YeaQ/YmgE (transglycosylase-associated protein family)